MLLGAHKLAPGDATIAAPSLQLFPDVHGPTPSGATPRRRARDTADRPSNLFAAVGFAATGIWNSFTGFSLNCSEDIVCAEFLLDVGFTFVL